MIIIKFSQFITCILIGACCLSGCQEFDSSLQIPVPSKAMGLEHHDMKRIKASQINFHLATRKKNTDVFVFYKKKFTEKGWILCNYKQHWINYVKNVGNNNLHILQNSMYMVSANEKQLLMVAAQYHIDSTETMKKTRSNDLMEKVTVVRYQLDDRGYDMAISRYDCSSRNKHSAS